jgi:hypothetical protein
VQEILPKGRKGDSPQRERWIDVLREKMGDSGGGSRQGPFSRKEDAEEETEGETEDGEGTESRETTYPVGKAKADEEDSEEVEESMDARIERIRSFSSSPKVLLAAHAIYRMRSAGNHIDADV